MPMDTATASFNTTVKLMTKTSQQKTYSWIWGISLQLS